MGNLDFANHAGFSWCCIVLVVGGLTMIVLGPLRSPSRSRATVDVVVGSVFFCYGLYLTFGFWGGRYYFPFYALIAPPLWITHMIRSSNGEKVRRREKAQQTRDAELQGALEAHAATINRRSK